MKINFQNRKLISAFILLFFTALFFFGRAPVYRANLTAADINSNGIEISGIIEYKKIGLSFKNPGKIERLNVDEGFMVKKGDLIASLDISELSIQKRKAENALLYVESLKPQLELMISFQKASYESQKMLAAANLNAAKARLDEAVAGNREQQIEQAKASMNKAFIEFDKLSKDYKRYVELSKSGSVTSQSLDTIRSQLLAAEQLKLSAEEQYNLLKAGARRETIELMKAGVAQAEAQIKGAEALAFQAKKAECDLESLMREIEVKKADIESIDNKISEASLTAPQDGMIIEKISETSEVVGAASSIAVLANLTDVWVRGYIPEEDMGKIKIGQKAVVISDSFKDKTYDGHISYISPEAEFTPKNVQTKRERVKLVYRVKINVDNSSRELKLGMPVDVKIKCDL